MIQLAAIRSTLNSMLTYLDPGAGSMILQALAGGVAGVMVVESSTGAESDGFFGLVEASRLRRASSLSLARSATGTGESSHGGDRVFRALSEAGRADWERARRRASSSRAHLERRARPDRAGG